MSAPRSATRDRRPAERAGAQAWGHGAVRRDGFGGGGRYAVRLWPEPRAGEGVLKAWPGAS